MSRIQIGVDLAKTVFEIAISEAPGVVTARRRLSRAGFPRFLAAQAPAEVLLEACGSALRAGAVTDQPDDLRLWATEVSRRHCHNVAAVALANKLARICWRTWRDERDFERREAQVTNC